MTIRHVSVDVSSLLEANPQTPMAIAQALAESRFNPSGLNPQEICLLYRELEVQADAIQHLTNTPLTPYQLFTALMCRLGHADPSPEDTRDVQGLVISVIDQTPPKAVKGAVSAVQGVLRRGYTFNLTANTGFIGGDVLLEYYLKAGFPDPDFKVFSEEERMAKPSEEFFIECLTRANRYLYFDPESPKRKLGLREVLHVGTHARYDAEAAVSAGFNALLVDHPTTQFTIADLPMFLDVQKQHSIALL